jgi:hypothetical protein
MQRCSCKIIVSGKVVNEQQQLRNVTEWIDCAYTVSTLGGGGGNGGVDEVATVSTYRSLGGGADQADGERKSQSFFFWDQESRYLDTVTEAHVNRPNQWYVGPIRDRPQAL